MTGHDDIPKWQKVTISLLFGFTVTAFAGALFAEWCMGQFLLVLWIICGIFLASATAYLVVLGFDGSDSL